MAESAGITWPAGLVIALAALEPCSRCILQVACREKGFDVVSDIPTSGTMPMLGPLESEVLECVSILGNASVADIHETLSRSREIAYTTAMTVAARLVTKGVLKRRKSGRKFLYAVSAAPSGKTRGQMRALFRSLLNRFSEPAIRQFVKAASELDDSVLAKLEAEIVRARGKRKP